MALFAADKKLEGFAVAFVVPVAFATAFVVFKVVIGVVIVTFACCAVDGTTRTNSNRNAIMPARTTLFMLINHPLSNSYRASI